MEGVFENCTVDQSTLRPCGECYACCVWLGIDELKKWAGQSCRRLDGSLGACTRCSIYEDRPDACRTYSCSWRGGVGTEDMRPDKSGVMVTIYPAGIPGYPELSATATVTDSRLSGTLEQLGSNLNLIVTQLVDSGFDCVRIVDYRTEECTELLRGQIRRGTIHRKSYEELTFITGDVVGSYKTARREEVK